MTPVTPSKYGWQDMLDGAWHLVKDGDPATFGHAGENIRLRNAAYKWGQSNGYRVRTHAANGGAKFYVQFAKGLSPWKGDRP